MKNRSSLHDKIFHKLHGPILNWVRQRWKGYRILYTSYRHFLLKRRKANAKEMDRSTLYYTQLPHSGAGIGHQIANWISGYWYARVFNLNYAYSSFSSQEWDDFLGFGESEISVKELCHIDGYRRVLLPPFYRSSEKDMQIIDGIFSSYSGKKIIFVAEQDTSYPEQYGVMEDIRYKFNNAKARNAEVLFYDQNHFNIAVHIRRGDVVENQGNANVLMRWLNNDYYVQILSEIMEYISDVGIIDIYLFSQGKEEDFCEFMAFDNVHFCLDTSAQESFLHMVRADLLITSKSSFSYKPALISEGIRICPRNFWHGYPDDTHWILVGDDGYIDEEQLGRLKELLLKEE